MAQTDFPTKVLIHAHGTLTWARLNQKMRPVNYQPCAPAAPMSLDALLADVTSRGRPSEVSVGKVPIVAAPFHLAVADYGRKRADQAPPITGLNNHSVKDILVLDLRRHVLYSPLVAPELTLLRMTPASVDPKCNTEAQELAGQTDKVNAADTRAIKLQDLILDKKIDLTPAAYHPSGSRAAICAKAEHTEVIPAGRGTPSAFDLCPMAAVPFQVIRQ